MSLEEQTPVQMPVMEEKENSGAAADSTTETNQVGKAQLLEQPAEGEKKEQEPQEAATTNGEAKEGMEGVVEGQAEVGFGLGGVYIG